MVRAAIAIVLASCAVVYGSIRYQDHLIDEMNRPTTTLVLTWEQCEQEGIDCR